MLKNVPKELIELSKQYIPSAPTSKPVRVVEFRRVYKWNDDYEDAAVITNNVILVTRTRDGEVKSGKPTSIDRYREVCVNWLINSTSTKEDMQTCIDLIIWLTECMERVNAT